MAMKKRLPENGGGEPEARGEFLLYTAEDGRTRIDCRFDGQTLWLTQAQIAELFQTTPQNITLHLKAIFAYGELDEAATCKDYLQVRFVEEYDKYHVRRLKWEEQASLGALIAGFKSASGRRINDLRQTPGVPVWHRDYYDIIIRDAAALANIRAYIRFNNEYVLAHSQRVVVGHLTPDGMLACILSEADPGKELVFL